jgi:hypothetical protein
MRKSKKLLGLLAGAFSAVALSAPSVSNATLTGPGGLAFVAFASRSTIADQFAVVFLQSVDQNEVVNFTSNNWSNTSSDWTSDEATYTWKANKSGGYPIGSVLEVFNTEPVSAKVFAADGVTDLTDYTDGDNTMVATPADNFLGLNNNGDNIIAYKGTVVAATTPLVAQPTFLAAMDFNGAHFNGFAKPTLGPNDTGDGDLPHPLTPGVNAIEFPTAVTGAYYNQTAGNVGDATALATVINSTGTNDNFAITTATPGTGGWTFVSGVNQVGGKDLNIDLPYNQGLAQPYGPYNNVEPQGFNVNENTTVSVSATLTPEAQPTFLPVSYQVTAGAHPGDIAFVALAAQSTIADQFAVVLLKGVAKDDTLSFTDNNWSNEYSAFETTENIIYWTADQAYPAGTVVQFLNTDPYTAQAYDTSGDPIGNGGYVSTDPHNGALGSSFGLDKGGDNLFVFVGTPGISGTPNAIPTFVTGLTYIFPWNNIATPNPTPAKIATADAKTSTSGELPTALLTSNNSGVTVQLDLSNETSGVALGGVNSTYGNFDGAWPVSGSQSTVDDTINDTADGNAQWAVQGNTPNTDLPSNVVPSL